MKYNKLVRDKIPKYIKSKGGNPITHIASDEEYGQKLKEKLQEEVSEFAESGSIDEMADIIEVLDAIQVHESLDLKELDEIREKKALERGKFEEKIILEEA